MNNFCFLSTTFELDGQGDRLRCPPMTPVSAPLRLLFCRDPHLESVGLGVDVTYIHASLVVEEKLFALAVGVNAHVVLITLLVADEWFHDERVQNTCHNLHLGRGDMIAEGKNRSYDICTPQWWCLTGQHSNQIGVGSFVRFEKSLLGDSS